MESEPFHKRVVAAMDQRRSHHHRIDRLSDIQPAGLYRLRRSGIAASAKAPEQFKVKLPVRPGKFQIIGLPVL